MCIICTEFRAGKLTVKEALRNYGEMQEIIEEDHKPEVDQLLYEGFWKEYSEQSMESGGEKEEDDDYYEETGFGD